MSRYIDAEKIKYTEYINGDVTVSKELVEKIPTADVQEVRHGMWMYCGKSSGHDHMWQCSECLRTEFTKHKRDIKNYPYCHCGTKMDAKE